MPAAWTGQIVLQFSVFEYLNMFDLHNKVQEFIRDRFPGQ